MNARYYDAATGRFVSQDPLGFGGGGANLYAYVDNNSVNLSDPTGQFIQFLALAGLAATFAGVATGYAAQHSESFADTLTDFGGWLSERTGTKNFTLSLGFMNVSWGKTSDGVESFGISGTIGLDGFGFGAGSIVRNAPGRGGVQVTPTANAGASYAGFSAGINAVGSSNSFSGGYAFGDGLVQAGPRFVMGADGSIDPTIGVSVGMPFGDASEGGHTWGVTAGAAYGLGSHRAYVDGGLAYYTGARTQNGVDAAGRPTYAKQATWQADYSRPAVTGTASIGAGGVRWEGAGVQWVPGYDDEMYGNGSWGRPSILTAAGAPRSDTMLFLMALPPAGGVEGDGVSREERLRRSSEVLKSFKQRARDAGMGSLTSDDLSTEANVIRVLEQITPSQPGYSQIVRQQARIISSAWQNLNDRANVELWTGGTIIGPVGGDPLVNGIAQSAGGVGEIAGAGLTLMSGVGLTIAGAMAVHGLDSIVAGARTWWTGENAETGTFAAAAGTARLFSGDADTQRAAGTFADFAPALVGMGASLWTSLQKIPTVLPVAAKQRGSFLDFVSSGRFGGKNLTPNQIRALGSRLGKDGMDLVDNPLEAWRVLQGNAGGFTNDATSSGLPTMYLKETTVATTTHEWLHARDWLSDPAGYLAKTRLQREQFVFDRMAIRGVWRGLNAEERTHYINYITRLGGESRGMTPISEGLMKPE